MCLYYPIIVPVYLLLVYILYLILSSVYHEITVLLRMSNYSKIKNTGIYYRPLVGYIWFIISSPKDHIGKLTQYFKANEQKKVIVCNDLFTRNGGLLFILNCPDVIKEYTVKEVDPACYTVRDPALCDHVNLGFFLRNGKAALDQRAIFSEFFLNENINALAEPT